MWNKAARQVSSYVEPGGLESKENSLATQKAGNQLIKQGEIVQDSKSWKTEISRILLVLWVVSTKSSYWPTLKIFEVNDELNQATNAVWPRSRSITYQINLNPYSSGLTKDKVYPFLEVNIFYFSFNCSFIQMCDLV